jgi:hypothetical protein
MAKGKDLDAFRQTYDRIAVIEQRIKRALAELGDSWEYEADFMKRAGIASVDWANRRSDYTAYVVLVKGNHGRGANGNTRRVIAGTAKFAEKLRAAIQ